MKRWQLISVLAGLGVGISSVWYLIFYKHGVHITSIDVEHKSDDMYTIILEVKNKSNVTREGYVELSMDGHIRDWQHLILLPDETWDGTTEVNAEEEICACVDTFNKDLHYLPFFLRPLNSKCINI